MKKADEPKQKLCIFRNRVTNIELPEYGSNPPKSISLDYASLVRSCLNNVPPQQGGLNPGQIKERIDVLNKFTGTVITNVFLTQAELNVLKTCESQMSWAIVHIDIYEFSEYIKSLIIQ